MYVSFIDFKPYLRPWHYLIEERDSVECVGCSLACLILFYFYFILFSLAFKCDRLVHLLLRVHVHLQHFTFYSRSLSLFRFPVIFFQFSTVVVVPLVCFLLFLLLFLRVYSSSFLIIHRFFFFFWISLFNFYVSVWL